MSWDNITGDQKILPGTGNSNEIKLESGKAKRVRLIGDQEPYSFLEHTIENEVTENGKTEKIFRTIRCPKTHDNPNAFCPICDGQRLSRRPRNAINTWDYDSNSVQKLSGGEKIFKPIATTRKLGVNVMGCDWAIMKTGEKRNDVDYTVTNLGATPFALPQDAVLFDIKAEYRPHTIDEMKAIVESTGLAWNDVIVPPTLEFPASLQDALEHVMPNGKYKDQTFEQMWNADPTPKGMIQFLATKSDRITMEKACAQVILVNLGGANIPGVPKYNGTSTAQTSAPAQPTQQAPAPTQASQPTQVSADRQAKINEINKILSSKEEFVKGGFDVMISKMKEASGGKTNIVEFTDADLDKMLELIK